jgi:PKD repeat protein
MHQHSLEQLESRKLLSATLTALSTDSTASLGLSATHATATTVKIVTGPTLHMNAETPFSGVVGFFATPVLDPPLKFAATIDWGDGTTSDATLKYGMHDKAFGLIISGQHTYAKLGEYTVTTTLLKEPISPTSTLPKAIVEKIVDKAEVGPKTVAGPTLNLTAGTPFSGKVGFFATPVLDPPLKYEAKINWGDGKTSEATLTYGMQGQVPGLIISGSHTYLIPGKYKVTTTLVTTPVSAQSKLPTTIIEQIVDQANVATLPPNSSGGVTIQEKAGKQFTAKLGTFHAPAPGTNLVAMISWGDGTIDKGTIMGIGVQGIDVIKFQVSGMHKYAMVGKYAIHIVITRPGATPTAKRTVLTSIESTALVTA